MRYKLSGMVERIMDVSDADRSWDLMKITLERLPPDVTTAIWAVTIPKWFTVETIEFLCPDITTPASEVFEELINRHTLFEPWADRGWNINNVSRKELILHYPNKAFKDSYSRTNKYFKQDPENSMHVFATRKYAHLKRFLNV